VQHYYDIIDALPRGKYCADLPWRLDDTVYYHITRHFVVDVRIWELELILTHPKYDEYGDKALWFRLFSKQCLENGEDPVEFRVPLLPYEKDEQGWLKYEEGTLEFLRKCTLVNWYVGIDLPVGHNIDLDPDDPCEGFPTLNDALRCAHPIKCSNRVAKSALHRYIRRGQQFIAHTHGKPVSMMGFPRYRRWGERRVYWRRK
jgi:hypothetical protein